MTEHQASSTGRAVRRNSRFLDQGPTAGPASAAGSPAPLAALAVSGAPTHRSPLENPTRRRSDQVGSMTCLPWITPPSISRSAHRKGHWSGPGPGTYPASRRGSEQRNNSVEPRNPTSARVGDRPAIVGSHPVKDRGWSLGKVHCTAISPAQRKDRSLKSNRWPTPGATRTFSCGVGAAALRDRSRTSPRQLSSIRANLG